MRLTQAEAELANYYREYPWEHYKGLPEYVVKKMGLGSNLLQELPDLDNRNRGDIHNWLKSRNFTYEELTWIGW